MGGGIEVKDVAKAVTQVGDPVAEAEKAKNTYDKIDMHDWSAKGMAKNYLTGVAGNAHVAAAHMKGANIATLGAGSGALLPASAAFSFAGDKLSQLASAF